MISPQGVRGPLGPPGPVRQFYSSQLSSQELLETRSLKPDTFPTVHDLFAQLLGLSSRQHTSHDQSSRQHTSHDQSEIVLPHSTSYCLPLFTPVHSTGRHRQRPAHNCDHVRVLDQSVEDGFYWVDPNLGCSSDAVKVYCRFTSNETCIYPNVSVRECYTTPISSSYRSKVTH